MSPISGTAASTMKSDCRRKITPALSLAPGLLRRRNIEQQIVSGNLFFPVLFEMGLHRLFSVSSAVNYVAPGYVGMVCSLLVTSGLVMFGRFPVMARGVRQMF